MVRYKSLAIARVVVATLKVNLSCGNLHLLSHVQDGASPLYIASQNGHTAVVDILIEAGADVHQAMTTVWSTVVVELVSTFVLPMSCPNDVE